MAPLETTDDPKRADIIGKKECHYI